MDAKLKSLDLGTTRSGRNQLLVVGFVVCCLLLPPASDGKAVQAGFTSYIVYSNMSSTPGTGGLSVTTAVLQSPANETALLLHSDFIGNAYIPICYLEVGLDEYAYSNSVGAAPAPNGDTSVIYVPWSVPCPRKQVAAPQNSFYNGSCIFTFTIDGDIQVLGNNTGGPTTLYWSSNTSGLGATTMDLLDTDPTRSGSIVLYNNQSQVVWQNVRNMSYQNYNCGEGYSQSTAAAIRISFASHGLLVVLSAALLLHFLLP